MVRLIKVFKDVLYRWIIYNDKIYYCINNQIKSNNRNNNIKLVVNNGSIKNILIK